MVYLFAVEVILMHKKQLLFFCWLFGSECLKNGLKQSCTKSNFQVKQYSLHKLSKKSCKKFKEQKCVLHSIETFRFISWYFFLDLLLHYSFAKGDKHWKTYSDDIWLPSCQKCNIFYLFLSTSQLTGKQTFQINAISV